MKLFLILSFLVTALNFPLCAGSLTMESTNYKLITDVISVGGETSDSTNYKIFNTVGEFGVTPTRSTASNYFIDAGFQAAASAVNLGVTLSTDSINLGTLSLSSVSSGSQTLTIYTDSPTGYTTTIKADGSLRSGSNSIANIPWDGTVTAGTSGYGISTSGSDGRMNSSATSTPLTTSDQVVAASSTPVVGAQTTITYKAAVGATTAYGVYSQAVTFTTTVNY